MEKLWAVLSCYTTVISGAAWQALEGADSTTVLCDVNLVRRYQYRNLSLQSFAKDACLHNPYSYMYLG